MILLQVRRPGFPIAFLMAFLPAFSVAGCGPPAEAPAEPPRPRASHECLDAPPCAAPVFDALANAERDAKNGDAQRQALVIARSLRESDCAGANQIWHIAYLRRGETEILIERQRDASRAIEAACPLR